MPIRPENRDRYPANWHGISLAIRRRADNRCEECGVPNYELGGRDSSGGWHKAIPTGTNGVGLTWPAPGDHGWCDGWAATLRIVRIVLTVAHLNHQPEDCRPENLRCLCQRCHNRYDAAERRNGIRSRARAGKAIADLFVVLLVAVLLTACVARAPDGSTQWDVGTTVKALSCANADLSRADERARCHVESGR